MNAVENIKHTGAQKALYDSIVTSLQRVQEWAEMAPNNGLSEFEGYVANINEDLTHAVECYNEWKKGENHANY